MSPSTDTPSKAKAFEARMSKSIHMGKKVARSLLPGVAPSSFFFRKSVIVVVVDALRGSHCIARAKDGSRCGNEVQAQAVLEALADLYKITSDDNELMEGLVDIAEKCTCRHKEMNEHYSLQARKIAENWMDQTTAMDMWEISTL
ncbi:hypothetical protein D0867_09656 [Hortaea werneckii]|uniref:Uncharacterized protein n=1 Tax=Hortaea werneckii TaxID=91943 RepID=A0A3M6YUH1_HORWE|nr:hypothetical protein D0867_09656 [Hortaea werneckii]RMY26858.1 hypothetical protein D0866_10561 [Hortaea werneckii]